MSAVIYPTYFASRSKATLDPKPRSRTKAGYVTKVGTIITLPAFSIETTWRGASEIVGKFNYTLGNNISVLRIEPQAGYCACVSWKPTSETIVRYKLWEDVREILYVDLYSGERLGSEITIEIWNVKPLVGTGGEGDEAIQLITEDGAEFIAETGEEFIAESSEGGDEYVGTIETLVQESFTLFRTSMLHIPTGLCEHDEVDIGGTPDLCTDITFELATWNPFNGDYYVVDGNCGETVIIRGVTLQVASIVFRCDKDNTYHEVFFGDLGDGNITYYVEQDNAPESLTPYAILKEIYFNVGYRINILKIADTYTLGVEQNIAEPIDYNVIYFAVGAAYYGGRLARQGSEVYFIPSQTPL